MAGKEKHTPCTSSTAFTTSSSAKGEASPGLPRKSTAPSHMPTKSLRARASTLSCSAASGTSSGTISSATCRTTRHTVSPNNIQERCRTGHAQGERASPKGPTIVVAAEQAACRPARQANQAFNFFTACARVWHAAGRTLPANASGSKRRETKNECCIMKNEQPTPHAGKTPRRPAHLLTLGEN